MPAATARSAPADKVVAREVLTPTGTVGPRRRYARETGIRPYGTGNLVWEVVLTPGADATKGDGEPWELDHIKSPHFLEEKQRQVGKDKGFRRGDQVWVRTSDMLVHLIVNSINGDEVHTDLYQGNPHIFGDPDLTRANWEVATVEERGGKWVIEIDNRRVDRAGEFDERIKAVRWLNGRKAGIPIDA